ncbi:MAG TPA: DUF2127 domain-containing protein [Streptosporangiaceae bacterium]|jgi:uncharacterized membrane protein (DUF2068 family)
MDWSLVGCGKSGHVTYAPDEPEVRARLLAAAADGESWRCLRCAAFVPGSPTGSGSADEAPRVRRGKEIRSALILRLFAVERFVRALLFIALAYGLWRFRYARHSIEATFDRERPVVRELLLQLGYNIDHSKLVGLIQHALTLSTRSLTLLAAGLAGYAVVEVFEGVGLWLTRRWGEYFAMIATSVGLPLEIYDLTRKITATTLIFLAVNLALVVYLVIVKRLFGVRGGHAAYEARLRSESVMEAAIAAAAAARPAVERAADAGDADGQVGAGGVTGAAGNADASGDAGNGRDAKERDAEPDGAPGAPVTPASPG